jgi:EpsI family protein
MKGLRRWIAPLILAAGLGLAWNGQNQTESALRLPLAAAVPTVLGGYSGVDVPISAEEQRVAGMTTYLYRRYAVDELSPAFTLYVGYYASQAYGRSIHSPKNCLPGAGWEALDTRRVAVGAGGVEVSYNVLQRGDQRALALYWYQGRGRVEADEYRVKWDLVRDAALHGRTEEALVRVVIPITREESARATALAVARQVIPAVERALPG